MFDVEKIRRDFPMLRGLQMQGKKLVYLDNAATSFKPYSVIKAIENYYYNCTANAHRGDYDLSHEVDELYENSRAKVAKFIGAKRSEVVFTSGASMSLNLVAYGYGVKYLKENDEILLTEAEHASNILPWFKVAEITGCKIKYVPLDEDGRLTLENVKKTITSNTKIIAVAHVTNVMGYIIDVKSIAELAHQNGSILVVDGAQSVPHMKIDVKDLDCDFLCFSGHKMCGPTGIGVLYGKYELLDKMDPLLSGGGMNTRFDMCGDVGLQIPPLKFEAGTQNIEGAIGLAAAVEYLENIGMQQIEQYENQLRTYAVEKMKEIEDITIYNSKAETGIITFNLKGVFAQDAASLLNSKGVCVRSGQHCAKILMERLQTLATLRASIYFYNTKEDIDIFIEACKKGGDFLDAFFND